MWGAYLAKVYLQIHLNESCQTLEMIHVAHTTPRSAHRSRSIKTVRFSRSAAGGTCVARPCVITYQHTYSHPPLPAHIHQTRQKPTPRNTPIRHDFKCERKPRDEAWEGVEGGGRGWGARANEEGAGRGEGVEKIERKRDRERWRETENDGGRETERISVTLPPAGSCKGNPTPKCTTKPHATHTHMGHDGLRGRLNVSINPNIRLWSTRRTIATCLPTRERLSAWCLGIVFYARHMSQIY